MIVGLFKIEISLIFISLLVVSTFTHIQVPFLAFSPPQLANSQILYEWSYLVIGTYTTNLQMLAVVMCIILLKPFWAARTFAIYLFLGWWGLPLFYYGGGSAYWQQASLGYLLALLPSCWIFHLFYNPQQLKFSNLFGSGLITLFSCHIMGSLYAGFYLQIVPVEFLLTYTVPQWLWQVIALAFVSFMLTIFTPRKTPQRLTTGTQWRQSAAQS